VKILLLQTSFLGDAILSSPVISALKVLHPAAEIYLMATPHACQLFASDPRLSGIIPFDKNRTERGLLSLLRKSRELRKLNFDRAYVLQRSLRSACLIWLSKIPYRVGFKNSKLNWVYQRRESRQGFEHEVQRNLAILASEKLPESFYPEIQLYAPGAENISEPFRELTANGGYVVLVPGSAWRTKMWDSANYRELANQLLQEGLQVVLLGSPEESWVGEKVSRGLCLTNLIGKTGLGEMLSIIKAAALVVCNDSMALHLCSAFKVPNIAIFCSSVPEFGFGPWLNPNGHVMQLSGLECKPCGRHGFASCPTGTRKCMKYPSAQQVFESCLKTLSRSKRVLRSEDGR